MRGRMIYIKLFKYGYLGKVVQFTELNKVAAFEILAKDLAKRCPVQRISY